MGGSLAWEAAPQDRERLDASSASSNRPKALRLFYLPRPKALSHSARGTRSRSPPGKNVATIHWSGLLAVSTDRRTGQALETGRRLASETISPAIERCRKRRRRYCRSGRGRRPPTRTAVRTIRLPATALRMMTASRPVLAARAGPAVRDIRPGSRSTPPSSGSRRRSRAKCAKTRSPAPACSDRPICSRRCRGWCATCATSRQSGRARGRRRTRLDARYRDEPRPLTHTSATPSTPASRSGDRRAAADERALLQSAPPVLGNQI